MVPGLRFLFRLLQQHRVIPMFLEHFFVVLSVTLLECLVDDLGLP